MEYCGNSNCRKNLKAATFRRKRICKNCLRKFCSKCFNNQLRNPFKMIIEGYCYECYIQQNPDNIQYNKYFGQAIPTEKAVSFKQHQDLLCKNTNLVLLDPFTEFQKIRELGRGATARVFQVLSMSSEVFALKVLNSSNEFKYTQEEFLTTFKLSSPNIVKSYALYHFKNTYSILMEFCDSTLFSVLPELSRRSENVLAYVLREVLEALKLIHQQYIIHRDVKCENIFLTRDGQVKLGDFGMAAQLVRERDSRQTAAGTPYWEAPEVLKGDNYSTPCDIWSFGITCIELATGNPPNIDCQNLFALLAKLKSEKNPPRLPETFSVNFSKLVENCLQIVPESRMSASDLLKLPFLRDLDEDEGRNELVSVIAAHLMT